MKKNLLLLLF